ncbi:MAG: DALR anticodon-binding domain-containing protein, partial [Gammaproteobacteria bacterium]
RYTDALKQLATLRKPVDAFFDKVMVMDDDKIVRENRLSQLQQLRDLFLDIADLSCLPSA